MAKRKGALMEHTQRREDALMRAYLRRRGEVGHIVQTDIYEDISRDKSPKFWVSELRAASVMASMLKGDSLDGMIPTKKEMYREIYGRFVKLKQERPESNDKDILAEVLEQEAPSFYLTAGTTKVMVCKARKRWFANGKVK